MTTSSKEGAPYLVIQTDDERAEALRKAAAEATATRLKRTFSEARKIGAAENPEEAGCVPWYHFPQAGK
jgi:hypothetical protein